MRTWIERPKSFWISYVSKLNLVPKNALNDSTSKKPKQNLKEIGKQKVPIKFLPCESEVLISGVDCNFFSQNKGSDLKRDI